MSEANGFPVARLRMSGRVKFPDAPQLASQLSALLARRRVEIDLTRLEETDASILQVLVAARISARKAGQDLTLQVAAEGPVAELIGRLGLDAHLTANGALAGSSSMKSESVR